jgi:hypothetical protein
MFLWACATNEKKAKVFALFCACISHGRCIWGVSQHFLCAVGAVRKLDMRLLNGTLVCGPVEPLLMMIIGTCCSTEVSAHSCCRGLCAVVWQVDTSNRGTGLCAVVWQVDASCTKLHGISDVFSLHVRKWVDWHIFSESHTDLQLVIHWLRKVYADIRTRCGHII